MSSPNGGNAANNREEECVLSLLALQRRDRSVTPELNLNANTGKPAVAGPSPLPATPEPTIPKEPVETLIAQAPLSVSTNPARPAEAAKNTLHASAPPPREINESPTVPYPTATRLVAPPRSVPQLPSNNMAMANEFWLATQTEQGKKRMVADDRIWLEQAKNSMAKEVTKRKRNDHSHHPPLVPNNNLVPILPNGWEPDQDFDDTTPDAPLLPHYPLISMDEMIGGSPLVKKQDRNLVPDALFVAMAQLEPCRLTVADKTGSYRKLELGFVGFCCKHCGGQPGFGRYFPSTKRSCAQTTSSQTILKHMDSKCRYVPATIRNVVLELERIHQQKEINNDLGRPRYGARKVFFERVWKRLHDYEFSDDQKETVTASQSTNEDSATDFEKEKNSEEPATELETNEDNETATEEEEEEDANKESSLLADSTRERKCRFGRLPTKKNVQNRMKGFDGSNNKRARVWEV